MTNEEIKIIEELIEKAGEYSWYGWKHSHYKNGSVSVGGSMIRVSLMTIIPEFFIKVVIRFCYIVPYCKQTKEFKDDYENWHEFVLTDELCKSGVKKLIALNGQGDDSCEKKLKELFNAANKKPRFMDNSKERKLNLNKIADSL